MKIKMNAYTEEINGIKFSCTVEEPLQAQARLLLGAFAKIPPQRLKDGFKLQIGFSLFILAQTAEGYKILVPDYTQNPFAQTTEDLTVALWIQLEQTELLQKYNLSGEPVRFDDKIAVNENVLNQNQIFLQRFSDLGESGWCIKPVENAGENYQAYYAYQLLKIRPELIKVLALPCEYIAVFGGDALVEILNEQNQSII